MAYPVAAYPATGTADFEATARANLEAVRTTAIAEQTRLDNIIDAAGTSWIANSFSYTAIPDGNIPEVKLDITSAPTLNYHMVWDGSKMDWQALSVTEADMDITSAPTLNYHMVWDGSKMDWQALNVTEADIDINNAPTDAYVLTWNAVAGKPEWQVGGAAGTDTYQVKLTSAVDSADYLGSFAGAGLSVTATEIRAQLTAAEIASATALPVTTAADYYDVTGTTTITSIDTGGGVGVRIKLHFDDVLTLTHHATDLILPSGANITTAAGDEAEFVEYATGDWRCTNYSRADGRPVIGGGLTLLSKVTASASATIDVDATFDSTYDSYLIKAVEVVPATASAFGFLLKIGGSYLVADYRYHYTDSNTSSAAYGSDVSSSAAKVSLAAGDKISLDINIRNPTQTTTQHCVDFKGNAILTGILQRCDGVALNDNTGALTGVRFSFATGNITSGDFYLYGYKKTV